MRVRLHLAVCDYCGRRIAWSRKRRQWLSLAPYVEMRCSQLQRRMRCPQSTGSLHDPAVSAFTLARLRRFGDAR